ncbi:16302_t:CDS:2 [Dentiscutata erythropus]|uniref:16302_t:CDS:1 n=1 Tax=Dentiscutata erythropus TaxID=1348616 RepID=A0A9N9I5Z3_9GLOM|nr:16302_t:CDS:2 [Dentiscutata erythropus]
MSIDQNQQRELSNINYPNVNVNYFDTSNTNYKEVAHEGSYLLDSTSRKEVAREGFYLLDSTFKKNSTSIMDVLNKSRIKCREYYNDNCIELVGIYEEINFINTLCKKRPQQNRT